MMSGAGPRPCLLSRINPRLPDAVPAHPLLDGKREIGRGESSIVLDAGDGERVFKIVSSPADHFFLTAADRPQGPHFPRLFADHGIVGVASSGYSMHLLEVEYLQPAAGPAAELSQALQQAYRKGCTTWCHLGQDCGRLALYNLCQEPPPDFPESLVAALKSLSDFIEDYPVQPDLLNPDNLMMRADGTLVFSDPVFIP